MLITVWVEDFYILHMIEAEWWTSSSVFQRFCGKCFIMPVDKTKKKKKREDKMSVFLT